jgi:hypothetical protein
VFRCSYTEPDKFFPAAVERARRALVDAGRDGSRLDGYTWHCNRHTFASRLVMAGVDLSLRTGTRGMADAGYGAAVLASGTGTFARGG